MMTAGMIGSRTYRAYRANDSRICSGMSHLADNFRSQHRMSFLRDLRTDATPLLRQHHGTPSPRVRDKMAVGAGPDFFISGAFHGHTPQAPHRPGPHRRDGPEGP